MWKQRTFIVVTLSVLAIGSIVLLSLFLLAVRGMNLTPFFLSAKEEVEAEEKEHNDATIQQVNADISFPDSIAGMNMNRLISGPEAMQNIENILGSDLSIKSAYIPCYNSGEKQLTIWIAEMSSPEEAETLVDMIEHHSLESNTFNRGHKFAYENSKIHFAECCQRFDHYYYSKRNRVFWISIMGDDSEPIFYEVYHKF